MIEILSWLEKYSPAVVALIVIGAALIYLLKLIVDKSVDAGFSTHVKELELSLQSRSTFKDKVLTERFVRITELSARLEKVMTNLNRIRNGKPVPDGFQKDKEIIPLTEIYEDLNIHRLTLTEEFYDLLINRADLTLEYANTPGDKWDELAPRSRKIGDELRAAMENAFKISEIKF